MRSVRLSDCGQRTECRVHETCIGCIPHGALSFDDKEIRARRMQLGMSQTQFGEYLGTGPASVKRWELGQVQDKAMDELIRLKTDPEAARQPGFNRQNCKST